jgi:hypothetical protein
MRPANAAPEIHLPLHSPAMLISVVMSKRSTLDHRARSSSTAAAGGYAAGLSRPRVAVGKTLGEPAGLLVRVGSENGHLVRRTRAVRREGVVHGGSEVHLRKSAARSLERLYPTASREKEQRRSVDRAQAGAWSFPSVSHVSRRRLVPAGAGVRMATLAARVQGGHLPKVV